VGQYRRAFAAALSFVSLLMLALFSCSLAESNCNTAALLVRADWNWSP
jgi:hypothetical protein